MIFPIANYSVAEMTFSYNSFLKSLHPFFFFFQFDPQVPNLVWKKLVYKSTNKSIHPTSTKHIPCKSLCYGIVDPKHLNLQSL